LNKIAEDGSVPFDINDASIKYCYQKGWIQRIALDDAEDTAILPSPLHEKYFSHVSISLLLFCSGCLGYIEYSIGRAAKPLPARFDLLPNLCKDVLSEFSIMNLRHSSKGKKMSSAPQPRPLEAQYQDEFYSGFNHVAGRGVPISSE